MSVIEIRMPKEDREGTAACIGRWLKQRGEAVQEHEPLLEIDTDKVTVEIAAPASGVLAEQAKREGDDVAPGELLGNITATGVVAEQAAEQSKEGASLQRREKHSPHSTESRDLAPAVRRLLQEHGLEAASIPRLGRGERLSLRDVESYLGQSVECVPTRFGSQEPQAVSSGRIVPHTAMRRTIADHMARSVQAAPHVTSVFEADLSAVLRDREQRKQTAEGGAVPSITAYLIHAAVRAIREVPEVNSRWHERHLEVFERVNFGVGTATEAGGLVVPVIRDAQAMDLHTISEHLRTLTERARKGRLTREEMQEGTFSLSNHGVSGSLLAAPIILPHGQTAILGTGKLQKRVIVCETGGRELFRVRPMMYVTLTVDHRVLDAQQTNAFLTGFVAALENAVSN